MKRKTVVVVGLGVALLTGWGCAQVIGLPEGEWATVCEGNDKRCVDNAVEECVDGLWEVREKCTSQWCGDPPACVGICGPGQTQCKGDGKTLQGCADGEFVDAEVCPYVCVDGACTGECAPGETRCTGQTVQTCSTVGQWEATTNCTSQGKLCAVGSCIAMPPSCLSLANDCGPAGDENCCAVTAVPGGTYNRSNDPAYPATVSDFWLDRFEITVGRFRKFVEAYPGSKPVANAGAHPLIAQSGWDSSWDMNLPADEAALKAAVKCSSSYQTWTDTPGANENLPMNCSSWYVAFAFCAWDGGRLPTEAEWNYAAAGGNEQREYPWSNPPNSQTIDGTYATYGCGGDGCTFADILKVGSKSPKGDSRWGQADMGGSMWEWNLDWYGTYPTECTNCANILNGSFRVFRGGNWNVASSLLSSVRNYGTPDDRNDDLGVRCARTPL